MKNKIVISIMSIVIAILSVFTVLYFVGGQSSQDSKTTTSAVKTGDYVVIDFKGTINNKAFKGGEANGYELKIGSKSFIDNFEDQLVGHKIGDTVDVKVKFPKTYFEKKYAGKDAIFKTKIKGIYSFHGEK